MDVASIRRELVSLDRTRSALAALCAPQSDVVVRVTAGQVLQTAIDTAPPGATLLLEPAIYAGPVRIWKPLTLRPSVVAGSVVELPPGRAMPDQTPVILTSGAETVKVVGPDAKLLGLCVQSTDPNQTLVAVTGPRATLDRCVILGDAIKGQHRGVSLNGDTALVTHCYIDHCFQYARDAQACYTDNGGKHLTIVDSYLGGGAQSFMAGGGDPSSFDRVPEDILIDRCLLGKKREWFSLKDSAGNSAQIKCSLELKNVRGFIARNSHFHYAGVSQGQGAYLIVATVRNQSGTAPYSSIEDVLIERCTGAYAGGCLNILGSDDVKLSDKLRRLTMREMTFTDLDPLGLTKGAGWCVLINRAPESVTLEEWIVKGQNLNAGLYVIGANKPPPVKFVARNLAFPAVKYGAKLDAGGQGIAALKAYMPDAVLENLTAGGGTPL
jgi:hypothetical protein